MRLLSSTSPLILKFGLKFLNLKLKTLRNRKELTRPTSIKRGFSLLHSDKLGGLRFSGGFCLICTLFSFYVKNEGRNMGETYQGFVGCQYNWHQDSSLNLFKLWLKREPKRKVVQWCPDISRSMHCIALHNKCAENLFYIRECAKTGPHSSHTCPECLSFCWYILGNTDLNNWATFHPSTSPVRDNKLSSILPLL